MLKNILKSLESSKHPLLGPNIKGLQFSGMLQQGNKCSKYIYNFIHFIATVFVVSQYIELWKIRSDLPSALRNLSITTLSTVCIAKAWTVVFWQKYWEEIIQSISQREIEQQARNDSATNIILKDYKIYSRFVTYSYCVLVTATVFTVIFAPLAVYFSTAEYKDKSTNETVPYPAIISSWVPFDKTKLFGYWAYMLEHTLICIYGGFVIAAHDSSAVAIMTFFAGQLRLLKNDCFKIFGDLKPVSDEEAFMNIRNCHQQHVFLIRYSRIFNSLLSPVMFLYIFICSLMICCSAIQLTNKGTTRMQQVWIAEYLIALIAQLILFCWHGNEVLWMSQQVDRGVYESGWWTRSVRMRRSILLLAGQLRKTIIFKAGPFTSLTITTFVSILKGAYSYYAVLNKN